MNFGKILTAMVTPFNGSGELNYDAATDLIEHLLANGSDGIIVGGTTGESPTLSSTEKINLYEHTVRITNGRIPVIAGSGSNDTRESILLTGEAEKAGVDGVMLVTPYYNRPSQEGLYEHFKAIAAVTHLPVMLYNVPGRTAVNLEPSTVVQLAQIDNIIAVKEASGDLDAMAEIIRGTNNDFSVYCGDDMLTLPSLSIGATGVVSVASHIVGDRMQRMIHCHQKGDHHFAASIHRELLPVMQSLFSAPNPTPVKAALEMKGINVGSVRLPLIPLKEEEISQLYESIHTYLDGEDANSAAV